MTVFYMRNKEHYDIQSSNPACQSLVQHPKNDVNVTILDTVQLEPKIRCILLATGMASEGHSAIRHLETHVPKYMYCDSTQ
jgi:hypothetical protein